LEPLCTVFFDRIENFGLEPLEDQAIGPFNLTIAPGVHYGGIVDVDAALLAVVQEIGACERGTQIGNDSIRHSEMV
jgi:hypothetical protein